MKGQSTGQNDLQVVEPDTLSQGEYVALAVASGEGTPEFRAWLGRRCRRG